MKSGVYLLKVPYNGTNMLKIGYSKNIVKRLKTHISSNPLLQVIGYIETDDYKRLEKEIHYKCRNYHYKLEWFYDREVIINYFKENELFKEIN